MATTIDANAADEKSDKSIWRLLNIRCTRSGKTIHIHGITRITSFKKKKGILPMKFIYPAVFRPTEDKKYNAFFPDLVCCEASGDTLDDAIENANAAAYDWIYTELMEFEGKLPPVSDESDLELQEGDVVRNISVNIRFQDGWDE